MPVKRNQLTVEVSPETLRDIEELLSRGYILSVQDLLRRAIDNELERVSQSIRERRVIRHLGEFEAHESEAPKAKKS